MEISIFFCLAAVIVLAVCVWILWKSSLNQKNEYDNLQTSYHQLEALNLELRAQRHDYLNQLHVIAGLAEVEEYEELQKYLKPLLLEQEKTGKAIRTRSAAVNALFAAKMNEAEKNGVDFFLEVSSGLENLPLPDWDLVRILSNLIDNALTAAADFHPGEGSKVRVKVSESENSFLFEIINNGKDITPDQWDKIYDAGYTTKEGDGHGMGLYITRQLVKQYSGTINGQSEAGETAFRVSFKKERR